MNDIFINVNLLKGDATKIIERFTRPIQVLRMRCLKQQLILPPMPQLKKLKIRHLSSSCQEHPESTCEDLCRLTSVDFPQLKAVFLWIG
jgi:hypothetical protein